MPIVGGGFADPNGDGELMMTDEGVVFVPHGMELVGTPKGMMLIPQGRSGDLVMLSDGTVALNDGQTVEPEPEPEPEPQPQQSQQPQMMMMGGYGHPQMMMPGMMMGGQPMMMPGMMGGFGGMGGMPMGGMPMGGYGGFGGYGQPGGVYEGQPADPQFTYQMSVQPSANYYGSGGGFGGSNAMFGMDPGLMKFVIFFDLVLSHLTNAPCSCLLGRPSLHLALRPTITKRASLAVRPT